MITTTNDRKNKQIGAITTFIIHLLLLIFFILWKIWPFDPPLAPRYGIEVNFGTTDFGTGDTQTENPPSETETNDETNEINENEPVENQEVETETSSEVVEQQTEVVESEVESFQEENPNQTNTNVSENQENSESESEQETENTETSTSNSSSENNNGDDENKTGDKGKEEGTIDAKNLYGNPGGGDGFSTNITGWIPDFAPKPKDNSNENGKVVFQVTIDGDGEIINIKTLEKTVSPSVELIYRREVEKLTFSKTNNNSSAAPTSTGTITFLIRSK